MAAGDLAFGSLNLNDSTYAVLGPLPIPASGPEIYRIALARREGSAKASRRFAEKTFVIHGIVKGASVSARETNLDALMLALADGEQDLKTGWQDERYYKAELMGEVMVQRYHGTSHFEYVAGFLLADPFGYAASASSSAPGAVAFTRA